MNKILTFILAFSVAIAASAIPAKRDFFVVKNADGTTLRISLRGDETFHFYVTEDGTPVRKNEQGNWVKDERDISALWQTASNRRNAHRFELAQRVHRAMKSPRRGGAVSDEEVKPKKGLLILVNFKDVKFKNTNERTKAIFDQMVNGLNNPYGRNKGSVREYFRDQSYNQFDIVFDVVGPVTVSQNMKYYGQNVDAQGKPDSEGDDAHPAEMVKEAIELVDNEVNFADYDWDGDGEVENIYVTYAGYGEASGASTNTIWPHQWQLYEGLGRKITLDGVKLDTYACGSELKGQSGSTIESIGTMCHEYSHCLGLPDFYDCDYKGYVDMADWSLMASGCNNNDGYTPCGYTAYERWFCGWLEPTELKKPCNIENIKPIVDEPEAYIIYNDKQPNEYYMLANHQQKGWDSKIKAHGMMILHVDYNRSAWANNTVNTTRNHPRMSIIPADNELKKSNGYYWADAGDLWPGTKNNTMLTDTSTPAATLFNANTDGKKFMHKDITEISEANSMISFVFMGGKEEPTMLPPTVKEPTAVAATEFTAQWDAVEGAVSYNLSLTEKYDDGQGTGDDVFDAIRVYDEFEKFFIEGSADATTDIAAQLDDYTTFTGWTGEKVYQGIYGAKIGSVRAIGWMMTPTLQSATSKLSVYLNALDWFKYQDYTENGTYTPDGSTIDVILLDAAGNELQRKNVKAPDYLELEENEYPEILVTFNDAPSSFKIMISTTAMRKRIYLSYCIVFDGDFTLEQIYTLFEAEPDYAMKKARRAPKYAIVTNTTEFNNITTTSYALTNLRPGATYSYRVQAVDSQGNKSDWSNPVNLILPPVIDAIQSITVPENAPEGSLYDLSGRQIINSVNRQLPKGIYILNGRKILIR